MEDRWDVDPSLPDPHSGVYEGGGEDSGGDRHSGPGDGAGGIHTDYDASIGSTNSRADPRTESHTDQTEGDRFRTFNYLPNY